MRRNVKIVGEAETKSIWSDFAHFPRLIFEFMAFIPLEIAKMLRRGYFLRALASVAAFGVFAQLLGWAIVNKPFWTHNGGREIFLVKFWGIDGIIFLVINSVLATLFLYRTVNSSKNN
jgi:hypothetical protein